MHSASILLVASLAGGGETHSPHVMRAHGQTQSTSKHTPILLEVKVPHLQGAFSQQRPEIGKWERAFRDVEETSYGLTR